MKTPPDKFSITITENDRLNADRFENCTKCLIATALRRRGYGIVTELIDEVVINGVWFNHGICGTDELHYKKMLGSKGPFYGKSVVGKRVVFTRQ